MNEQRPSNSLVPDQERDAFEAWALDKFSLHRNPRDPSRYLMETAAVSWKAWRARADLAIRESATLAGQARYLLKDQAAKADEIERLSATIEPPAAPMKMHVDYEWQKQRLESGGPAEECAAGGPSKPVTTGCIWEDCDQEAIYCAGHAREFAAPTPPPGALLADEVIAWQCGCGWINLDRESPFCAGCDSRRPSPTKEAPRNDRVVPHVCNCGHSWREHQTPGTECAVEDCPCGYYREIERLEFAPPADPGPVQTFEANGPELGFNTLCKNCRQRFGLHIAQDHAGNSSVCPTGETGDSR